MKKIVLILILFLNCQYLYSQNLVSNPSFEEHGKIFCKRINVTQSSKFSIKDWFWATNTSPDIFSTEVGEKCWSYATRPYSAINSAAGRQIPRTGKTMLGIYVYGKYKNSEYHEYIQTKLKSPLISGNFYYVEFWVTHSCLSDYASDNIGVYFSDTLINTMHTNSLYFTPQINEVEIITGSENWTKISGTFIASSSARYLIIGNFFNDSLTLTEKAGHRCYNPEFRFKGPYYYIDDVLVKQTDKIPEPLFENIKIEKGVSVILKKIFFYTNKSELLPESYDELNKLYKLMVKNQTMKIEVSGHTDNTGTEESNQQLSESRAKAVISYLTEKGIKSFRLSSVGYGSAKPVADNSTEEGRQQNRRVEITIIEK